MRPLVRYLIAAALAFAPPAWAQTWPEKPITDLLADRLDFAFLATANPQIQANKLRLLGVPSAARSAVFPESPTIAEAGTDMDMGATMVLGVYAPSAARVASSKNVSETGRL